MKAIKKTVQGIAIAISALVISQSAFAKASDSLKRLCSNAPVGEIVNEVRLSSYIESWTSQNPESYIIASNGTHIYVRDNDGNVPYELNPTGEASSFLHGEYNRKATKLFIALNKGDFETIVDLISNKGIYFDTINLYGTGQRVTPLRLAAAKGDLYVVKYLIEQGADINDKDERELTALHWAVDGNHVDIVKYLVEKGANIYAKNHQGHTVLDLIDSGVYTTGYEEMRNFLTQERSRRETLFNAVKNNNLDTVRNLINQRANVNIKDIDGKTALHWAADRDIAEALVRGGANIYAKDHQGNIALDIANIKNHTEVSSLLNQEKSKVENDLIGAIRDENFSIIKDLIQKVGIDFRDSSGHTLLHHAAYYGKLEVVKYLAEKGADVYYGGNVRFINAKNSRGSTALDLAAFSGHISNSIYSAIVKYLIEKGADVHDQKYSPHGSTQTEGEIFLMEQKSKVDSLLNNIHAGSSLNEMKEFINEARDSFLLDTRDRYGYTALHWATSWGHLELVRYLIEQGADVNARDNRGRTVLHWAINKNKLDVVKYLVNDYEYNVPYRATNGTNQQHQAVRVQQLAKLAYLTGQKVSMCIDPSKSPSEVLVMEVSE